VEARDTALNNDRLISELVNDLDSIMNRIRPYSETLSNRSPTTQATIENWLKSILPVFVSLIAKCRTTCRQVIEISHFVQEIARLRFVHRMLRREQLAKSLGEFSKQQTRLTREIDNVCLGWLLMLTCTLY
jgi:hypothetical protein